MRTYFCFLIPRTDLSARLNLRCALFLILTTLLINVSGFGQKCPGGLDSIQQVSVTLDCDGGILIAWDAQPDKCYNFSIPGVITQTDVSSGQISLTGSGSGISTGTTFYVNESCNSGSGTDPCQSSSGSTSVDIYEGRLPDLSSLGTWIFKSSGTSSNTKDVGTIFSDDSPNNIPNTVALSNITAQSNSIIRPSGAATADAKYCITAEFNKGTLDSIVLIGDNVVGLKSSGLMNNSIAQYTFCLDQPGITAGTYLNSIVAFRGRCVDTLENIQTIILPGSDVPTLACNGFLQISLTGSGTVITPAMMLPGQSTDNRISFVEGTNSNVLDCSHAGKNVNVVVLDTIFNQKCWGVVAVRDKSIATVSASDTVITCLEDMNSLTSENLLDISFNCGDLSQFDISHSDDIIPGDCTGDTLKSIQRTWIVRDESGRVFNALSNIIIEKIPFDTIVFPGDTTIYCPDTSFAISNTGGLNLDLDTLVTFCKIQVGFSDREIPTGCSGMKKIERSWLAIDWCNNVMNDTIQYITLLDTLPPVISCPTGDINGIRKLLTTLDTCGAFFVLPNVIATDSCSDDNLITYDAKVDGVIVTGQDSVFVPVGEVVVEYIARDDCGNETSCLDTISVQDNTPPTLNGPSIIQVTHSGSGTTMIPISLLAQAYDIDDNCALDSIFVRRMTSRCGISDDLVFGQSISICCADTDTLVPIELLARDTSGLENTLMVLIDAKDGVAPVVTCQDTIVFLDATGVFVVEDSSFFVTSFSDNCGFDVSFAYSRDTLVRADTNAVVQLQVTVSDIDGSTSSCISMVTVRDTFSNSGVNLLLGRVTDPFDVGLGGIKVNVNSSEKVNQDLVTDGNGFFELQEIEKTENLSVKINGYGNDMSGVSSLDLFLIQKHILGLEKLENNYLELAADVDQSGQVSVKDLISLQNAILDLPNKAKLPWVFMEENKVANTLVYNSNEVIPVSPTDLEFKAVKLGDVNGDIYNDAFGRSNGYTDLLIENTSLAMDKASEIPLSILSEDGIVSFFISLKISPKDEVSFIPNSLSPQISIEWSETDDNISILGYGEFGESNRVSIGSLKINTNKEVMSTELFSIDQESEVYTQYREQKKVGLSWYENENSQIDISDEIFELTPNPAIDKVRISINSDLNSIKNFYIRDITGKIVVNLSDISSSEFTIPTSLFPTSGSYLVSIETTRGIQNDILLINKK